MNKKVPEFTVEEIIEIIKNHPDIAYATVITTDEMDKFLKSFNENYESEEELYKEDKLNETH